MSEGFLSAARIRSADASAKRSTASTAGPGETTLELSRIKHAQWLLPPADLLCVMSEQAAAALTATVSRFGLLMAPGLVGRDPSDAARNEVMKSFGLAHIASVAAQSLCIKDGASPDACGSREHGLYTTDERGLRHTLLLDVQQQPTICAILETICCSPIAAAVAGCLGEDAALVELCAWLADPGAEAVPIAPLGGGAATEDTPDAHSSAAAAAADRLDNQDEEHQDEERPSAHDGGGPPTELSVVVALGVVDPMMGPLRVWPCTHTAETHRKLTGSADGARAAVCGLGSVDMALEAGDALLLDRRLLCALGPNTAYHAFPWAVKMRRTVHLVATFTSADRMLVRPRSHLPSLLSGLAPARAPHPPILAGLASRLSLINMKQALALLAPPFDGDPPPPPCAPDAIAAINFADDVDDGRGQGKQPASLPALWQAWHQPELLSPTLADRYLRPQSARARGFAAALRAAAQGEAEAVRCWLASPEGAGTIDAKGGPTQSTLLMRASAYGHAELTRELLARFGADSNAVDREGSSALHAAAFCGHAACVEALVAHGANVDLPDREGDLAVAWATARGHDAVATFLVGQWFRPRVLPHLLEAAEIATLLSLWETVRPIHDNRMGHETIYLHAGQADGRGVLFAGDACARLLHRTIEAMRTHDPRTPGSGCPAGSLARDLTVRCCELHRYGVGGSLMNRDHRDSGSVLTLSVTLSDPRLVEGGLFVTWDGVERNEWTDADTPTVHPLEQGSGILFRSEDLHNVLPVTGGTGPRLSLVIELWAKQQLNNVHRYK